MLEGRCNEANRLTDIQKYKDKVKSPKNGKINQTHSLKWNKLAPYKSVAYFFYPIAL